MRVIIVGYGVQGKKRRKVAGSDSVGIVDPVAPEANWRDLSEVPTDLYDAALVCTPDEPKMALLRHLFSNGKHALIEKPLFAACEADLREIETLARRSGAVCYTAYNHRFEPHYVRMRDVIRSEELGRIYCCRMFYGNGTARLVHDSAWRDQGAGVLPDLGSHLLDTARFWFGDLGEDFKLVAADRFENRSADHVIVISEHSQPRLELEMTLLSWRNYFTCDILAERGSAHIESLCKWGPTSFTQRQRILPSGRPPEQTVTLVQDDPTWALEYEHFKGLCRERAPADLSNDIWLLRVLANLSNEVVRTVEKT
jgi:scyllo-inositol 2-dehydrogenase (NADP+)